MTIDIDRRLILSTLTILIDTNLMNLSPSKFISGRRLIRYTTSSYMTL
uniref:Uncharacterized protein n=1 Tax=Parascaris univalens TaxID=6257 RepID=A0A914ZDK2_PARUN